MKPRPLQRDPETGALLVVLTRGAFALISEEDAEWVGCYNWQLVSQYAIHFTGTKGNLVGEYLHRAILSRLGLLSGHVDHVNGDKLDCRRPNLRCCTRGDNSRNRKRPRTNTSGAKGVRVSPYGRYLAQVGFEGRKIHLGTFTTLEEAERVYEAAAAKYFGEFKRDRDDY